MKTPVKSAALFAAMALAALAHPAQADGVPVVTLTFDDNVKGHYTLAAPVLDRYGYKGAFNVVTDDVGKNDEYMTWDEIRDLHRRGHSVFSHTRSHPDLVKLKKNMGADAVTAELVHSRDVIRREIGTAPRFMCHPYGQSDAEVNALSRKAGMTPMLHCRRNFGADTTPENFAAILDDLIAKKTPRLDLLFHGISPDSGGWNPLSSGECFAKCIEELAAREKKGLIKVVDYEKFYGRGRGILCLTFDDPNWPRWVAAMPIFAKYEARASFFPNGRLGKGALNALKKLYDAGHSVGTHSVTHCRTPALVKKIGFEAFWKKEIEPQMNDLASAGIRTCSTAYPNSLRNRETDEGFIKHGITRLRAGVPGSRPHDPKGLKRAQLVPFAQLDKMYIQRKDIGKTAVMGGVGIGTFYNTDIEDLCAGIRRAAERDELMILYSHDIAKNPSGISMKTEWLERILATAAEEGMSICGMDDLPVYTGE